MKPIPSSICRLSGLAASLLAAACTSVSPPPPPATAPAHTAAASAANAIDAALQREIQTVVVIFAENRGFDTLYGLFPGADGIPGVNPGARGAYIAQTDRGAGGAVLAKLPQTWGGVTAAGQAVTVAQGATAGQDNRPFQIDAATGYQRSGIQVGQDVVTRDLYHRFFENQMQINGGRNDKFAAYADAGGLTMGYYDGSALAMWQVARRYTLADNFFMGAFGGSFLNHQYLICACAPEYPNAATAAAKPSISALQKDANGGFLPILSLAARSPASAMDGP
ncbi:MAG: alkaline phosphatase family protein, partial [Burkholderiaceae bacterium]